MALNESKFKYKLRAFSSCNISILSVLVIEALSVRYIMHHKSVLDIINNFIKLKIIASFCIFFVEPFKASSMTSFIGKAVSFGKYRKDKIIVS
jgi:hypothetical protein